MGVGGFGGGEEGQGFGGIWAKMGLGIWGGIWGDTGLGSRLDVHVLVHRVVQEEAESIFPDGSRCVIDHLGGAGLDPHQPAQPLHPNPWPPRPTLLSRVTSCTETCTMGLGSLPGFFICKERGGIRGGPTHL